MRYPTQDDLRSLSENERLKLLEDLWATFVAEPDTMPLSEEHRQELERRIEANERDADCGASWSDVRRRITSR